MQFYVWEPSIRVAASLARCRIALSDGLHVWAAPPFDQRTCGDDVHVMPVYGVRIINSIVKSKRS